MDRKKWIESLKVGDEVVVANHSEKEIKKINKITPTGQIVCSWGVRGTIRFDNRGDEIGGQTYWKRRLDECTEESRMLIHQKILVEKVKQSNFAKLTYDQLNRIMSIIQEQS